MLKLNDLFENFELAYEALNLYDYDKEKTDKVIGYFRISANMIYPFYKENDLCFLRLAPIYEKKIEETKAEILLLDYLNKVNVKVMEAVKMKDDELVKIINTKFGSFIVCAFYSVNSDSLEDYIEENGITKELIIEYGRTLGKLHKATYKLNKIERKDSDDFLNEIDSNLKKYAKNEKILDVFYKVKKEFLSFKKTNENYGLIHYDMEPDNIFYNERDGFSIIDFDDSHYNFYNMDIIRCLNEVKNIDKNMTIDFLNGYKKEMKIDYKINFECLDKLAKLQHYGEICRTLSVEVKDKPEWMVEVIDKLTIMLMEYEKEIL